VAIQITLGQFDNLLQEDYVKDMIVSAVNKATIFKEKLRRTGLIGGRRRVYPVQTAVSQGAGAAAEGGALPPVGAGSYKDALVQAKYLYSRYQITGQSLVFSDRIAFVEFGTRAMKDTNEALTLDVQRECWGDGQGILALVNNGAGYPAGTTTMTVDSAFGVLWGSLAANTTLNFRQNMVVQFSAENNGGAGYTVTGITGTTITISPALVNAIADNAQITRVGAYFTNIEIEGWLKMVGTAAFGTTLNYGTTYHGINRTNDPLWEGTCVDAGGVALSLTNIRSTKDTVFKRGGTPELSVNSTEITADYEALLVANQRFVPAKELSGGYTVLEHDGLGFTKDKDAPVKCLNLMTPSAIAWAQTGDPFWMKDSAGAILRVIEGYDIKTATLQWYANLDCEQPRYQAILFNLLHT
jgi:hypothetical protein